MAPGTGSGGVWRGVYARIAARTRRTNRLGLRSYRSSPWRSARLRRRARLREIARSSCLRARRCRFSGLYEPARSASTIRSCSSPSSSPSTSALCASLAMRLPAGLLDGLSGRRPPGGRPRGELGDAFARGLARRLGRRAPAGGLAVGAGRVMDVEDFEGVAQVLDVFAPLVQRPGAGLAGAGAAAAGAP